MSISVECPWCQSTFRVKDEYAGKRGRCPACKRPVTVPAAAPSPSPAVADGLVPLQADEEGRTESVSRSRRQTPGIELVGNDDDDGGYQLEQGPARKAKLVRVREGALSGVGVSAAGMRQAAEPTGVRRTPGEILAAFQDEIEPFRPSPLYSFWLLIVAGFMVLLPLAYVALIGLVIVALGYHAVHDVTIFQNTRGGNEMKTALIVYLLPLVCGAVLVAFMLKPLFAKAARPSKPRVLDPQVEPLLYAFIDGVCTSVGAPRPERIEVDCDVNASAGFSGGAFSLFPRKPVLTIGLGMVAGLDLKQFAGVMAHELGHISQGSGARLMDVISSINTWFARLVYERDSWDEGLAEMARLGNGYLMLFGGLVRLAVWLTRRVLWVLLRLGHLVNMVFLRQREFDADRYNARMIGAKSFARTMWRVNELQLASQYAMADLQSSWQQRRLPDNFPKLILANVPQIPKEMLDAYRKARGQAKTGLFDTHPSDRDRITRAKLEEPGEGIFDLEGPATDVFRDFDALARAATFDYYKSMLGREIRKDQLFPVAELVEAQVVAQEGHVASERFFVDALPMTQRFVLPGQYPKAPTHAKNAKLSLIEARSRQQAALEQALAAREPYPEAWLQLARAETAWTLRKAGNKLKAHEWGLPEATVNAAQSAMDEALATLQSLAEQWEPYAAAAALRLTQTLAILEVDTVADRVPDGRDRREEARTLYPCVAHLGGNVVSQLLPTIRARQVLGTLIEMYNDGKNETNQPLINAVLRGASDLHDRLDSLRLRVGDNLYYPFEHAQEDITLGRFALPAALPSKDDIGGLFETADAAIDRLMDLYQRALGRLTVTAEEVERVLGLEPIRANPVGSVEDKGRTPSV